MNNDLLRENNNNNNNNINLKNTTPNINNFDYGPNKNIDKNISINDTPQKKAFSNNPSNSVSNNQDNPDIINENNANSVPNEEEVSVNLDTLDETVVETLVYKNKFLFFCDISIK